MAKSTPLSPFPAPDASPVLTGGASARVRAAVKRAKLSSAEQVIVAQNLWQILESAVERGISKARVLVEGGAGTEGDSTKRLERYALNPAWDAAKRELRAGRLTKTADIYLRIAEAAGKLARQDADAYTTALFNGTRFGSGADTIEPENLYDELARLLRTVSLGVARQNDLKNIFRTIEARQLCYYTGSLRRNPDCKWSEVWPRVENSARLAGLHDDCGDWSLPYPSVLIGWGEQKPLTEESAFIAKSPYDPDAIDRRSLAVEVRLALLPIGPDGTPEPAFLTTPWTMPTDDGRQPTNDTAGEYLLSSKSGSRYHHPQGAADPQAAAFRSWSGTETEIAYYDEYGSRYPVRVDVVSPETCRRYLSLKGTGSPLNGFDLETIVDDRDPAA